MTIISRHISWKRAAKEAAKLNKNVRMHGKWSGLTNLNYSVVKTEKLIRRWGVKEKSL